MEFSIFQSYPYIPFMIYNIEKYFKIAGKLFKIPELGQHCVNLGISYIQLIRRHIISFRFVGFL